MIAAIALCAPALKNSSRRQDTYRTRLRKAASRTHPGSTVAAGSPDPPLALSRQDKARDEQPGAQDCEREHIGRPFPRGEQSREPGGQQQPGDGGGEQRGAEDRGAVTTARGALAPGDVHSDDGADQDSQVRNHPDDTPVLPPML